jgi:hypothetical protein
MLTVKISNDKTSEFGRHEYSVGKWRRRPLRDRCDGLLEEARPGRARTIDDDRVAAVIERTLRCDALVDPADGCGNWLFPHTTIRRMWACSRTVARQSTGQAIRCSSAFTCPRRTEPLSLDRREKAGSGTGSRTTGLADDAWHAGAPTLTALYNLAVCHTWMSPLGSSSANATSATGSSSWRF